MSVFGTWFQAELDKRGYDQRQAATVLGVRESTVHNWLHQNGKPSLGSVVKIARKFDIPPEVVWLYAGYEMPANSASLSESLKTARAEILASLPQFADIIDVVAARPPERQAIELAMIRRLLVDPESSQG